MRQIGSDSCWHPRSLIIDLTSADGIERVLAANAKICARVQKRSKMAAVDYHRCIDGKEFQRVLEASGDGVQITRVQLEACVEFQYLERTGARKVEFSDPNIADMEFSQFRALNDEYVGIKMGHGEARNGGMCDGIIGGGFLGSLGNTRVSGHLVAMDDQLR